MATNVHLTPDLERFARSCVESGSYNNMSEVVRSGLRLLQEAEERRRHFTSMLEASEAEAKREGVSSIESVLSEADEIIAAGGR
jgi:antitoxin ParD1/3/4